MTLRHWLPLLVPLFVASLAASAFGSASCAHARHLAVQTDAVFARAVFAVDDAETKACQQHVLSVADCAKADPKIAAALLDVRAVTLALQATPKNVAVPKNLPNLLADLTDVQAILAPLVGVPNAPPLLKSVGDTLSAAIAATIAVVTTFTTGGK